MSKFVADNSRIQITETVSGVDQTVFDANDDMPHIVGTSQINNQTISFAAMSQTEHQTVQKWVEIPGYGYQYIWHYRWAIDPAENSSIIDIANVPTDEDNNTIDVDFIVVQATGTRTVNGKDPRFNQALPSTIPSKTFSFQGSVLLEASGEVNGASWMRRIVSIYRSGAKIKMKVQESIARLDRDIEFYKFNAVNPSAESKFPHIADTASTYSLNITLFFGKFRQ